MHLTAFRMKSDVSSNQLNTHPFISAVISPLAVFLLDESSAGLLNLPSMAHRKSLDNRKSPARNTEA